MIVISAQLLYALSEYYAHSLPHKKADWHDIHTLSLEIFVGNRTLS
jgi:hypothetical protein